VIVLDGGPAAWGAAERDERAIAPWKAATWVKLRG
jgi:hypothetical protein